MEEMKLLESLVSFLKEVSPLVWDAALKKNQADAVSGTIWLLGCLILISVSISLAQYFHREMLAEKKRQEALARYDRDEDAISSLWALAATSLVGAFLLSILLLFLLHYIWQRLYAPEYYALKLLLETLR